MYNLIILVGYRGVGKSTIGRRLAGILGYHFLDTDDEVVCRRRKAIADIVADEGWQMFRKYEEEVLRSLGVLEKTVVATGGGAVLHQHLWPLLRQKAMVFWLDAAVEVITARLHKDPEGQRPSLTGRGMTEEIEQVLRQRMPLYRHAAHCRIDTTGKSVDMVLADIERQLAAFGPDDPETR